MEGPPHRSSRADAALTDVLRGAALGCVSRRGGHPGAAGCAPRPVTEVSVEPGGQSFLSPRTTDGPARGDLPALQLPSSITEARGASCSLAGAPE